MRALAFDLLWVDSWRRQRGLGMVDALEVEAERRMAGPPSGWMAGVMRAADSRPWATARNTFLTLSAFRSMTGEAASAACPAADAADAAGTGVAGDHLGIIEAQHAVKGAGMGHMA
jgi:hypothetical protein